MLVSKCLQLNQVCKFVTQRVIPKGTMGDKNSKMCLGHYTNVIKNFFISTQFEEVSEGGTLIFLIRAYRRILSNA
jgi:hypothetical protein